MKVLILSTRRVICEALIPLPISTGAAWGQLRDFRSSACHDPFHIDVQISGGVPRKGVEIKLGHRYLLFHTTRVGRILFWKEGVGFAFSDLCRADPRRAFPHVLSYRLDANGDDRCRLQIRVTGRWTSPLPIWIGQLWLRWVLGQIVRTVEHQLLFYAVAIKTVQRARNP